MGLIVNINGTLVSKENAMISVFDHGFLYGDGVFEGIRSYDGRIFLLDEHLERLYESAHTLMLKIPLTKKQMEKEIIKTLQANKLKDAYIRLVVSRGVGDLGLDPRKCKEPTIVIITDKIALYPKELYAKGLEIITVPTVRNFPEALNPAIKSLNYLNNIMAKIEAINCGYDEAIMLNHQGYVSECTGDNISMVKNGVVFAPPAYLGALKGITLAAVKQLTGKLKIKFEERILTRHDFYNADEVFLTGTAAEVIPVVKIDERIIDQGKPGKITLQLIKQFKLMTKTEGLKYRIT